MDNQELESEIRVLLENHTIRLKSVEDKVTELAQFGHNIQSLTLSVNELALNMKNMIQEQKKQGEKIQALENEPASNWKTAKHTALTVAVSVIVTAIVVCTVLAISKFIA